jgi:hypothetical protein
MEKIIILLIAGSFVIACNNRQGTKTESTVETNKKTDSTPANNNNNDNNVALPPSEIKPSPEENNTSNWSEEDENRFLRSCVGSAKLKVNAVRANQYCNCMLEKIKMEFSSYAQANRELSYDTAKMNRMVDECNFR